MQSWSVSFSVKVHAPINWLSIQGIPYNYANPLAEGGGFGTTMWLCSTHKDHCCIWDVFKSEGQTLSVKSPPLPIREVVGHNIDRCIRAQWLHSCRATVDDMIALSDSHTESVRPVCNVNNFAAYSTVVLQTQNFLLLWSMLFIAQPCVYNSDWPDT